MLTGTTKSYRSYGKRSTNTINVSTSKSWLRSPDRVLSISSDSDSDSDSSSSSGDDLFAQPSLSRPPAKGKAREAALAAIKAKRAAPPPPAARRQSPNKAQLADKENASSSSAIVASPRRPVFLKGRQRLIVHSPAVVASKRATRVRIAKSSTDSTDSLRSPLKPKVYGRRGATAAASKAPVIRDVTTDESDEGEPPAIPEPFAPRASTRPTRSSKLSGPEVILISDEEVEEEVDELESDEEYAPPSRSSAPSPSPPRRADPARTQHDFPPTLLPLLTQTLNSSPLDFTSFVAHPPAPFAATAGSAWTKLGEASYSEVFASVGEDGETLVIKIIPVSASRTQSDEVGASDVDELPFMSEAASVLRELEMGRMVGGDEFPVTGFVKFRGAFVVQGAYPDTLLEQWDSFKAAQNPPCDDQIRPDVLPASQTYVVITLAHGGSDLESFKLKSWTDAASILIQVAKTCAKAEEAIGFEHRDLHWGNVLVQPNAPDVAATLTSKMDSLTVGGTSSRGSSRSRAPPVSSGVTVTLIDFTLSRAQVKDRVLFDAFEDECIFQGEGDQQFDVYRTMRDHLGSDWSEFCPLTNLMASFLPSFWLHYLARKLLFSKKLKPPPSSAPSRSLPPSPLPPTRRGAVGTPTARSRTLPTPNRKSFDPAERTAYDALVIAEVLLADALQVAEAGLGKKTKGRGRAKGKGRIIKKKAGEGEEGWKNAGDFVQWWERETGES